MLRDTDFDKLKLYTLIIIILFYKELFSISVSMIAILHRSRILMMINDSRREAMQTHLNCFHNIRDLRGTNLP